ncbi:MAG: cysteine desulfurase NifS [Oscillospiraceae bacterium]|jgi:cysteine desulfurase|nr:cysteine desulfurase NifS [Oscillospiraceae bacterium]
MNQRIVYADNAATTSVSGNVLKAMMPYFTEHYGNPSNKLYGQGKYASAAVENARIKTSAALGCTPEEIFFTSGGTEADNWAIRGVMSAFLQENKKHIITSVFEHHAVLNTCAELEKKGFEVTYVPVDEEGIIKLDELKKAFRDSTALCTVMFVNNEIGTVQPIKQIGEICREKGVIFHTDAVQAVGNLPIDVNVFNIDLLSLSGHKIHGPKGVGALYVRKGIVLPSLITGGAQESGKRAGTENVPGIVGLGTAIEDAASGIPERTARLEKMRDRLISELLKIPETRLNGSASHRICGNVNISFGSIEGEGIILAMDLKGIAVSSGSACTSSSLDPSHVLLAIGLPHEVAHGSLRITIGDETTNEDIDYIIETVPQVVGKLRNMSPVWKN